MNYKERIRLITTAISIILLITSCTTDYEGSFPESNPLPVLNATITGDSALRATLTWSLGPQSNESSGKISDATIDLYANGRFKSTLQNNGNGRYQLPTTVPLYRDTLYTLKAYGAGVDTITGSTRIPNEPAITCTQTIVTSGTQSNMAFKLNITDTTSSYSALWIYVARVDTAQKIVKKPEDMLYGDGRLADDFNRSTDVSGMMSNGAFIYLYERAIRLDRQSLLDGHGEIIFNAGNMIGLNNVYVLAASPEYDRYCKAIFMQELQSTNLDLPFTYQNIMVPSNMSNGIGLFGGYSVKLIKINLAWPTDQYTL